MIFLSLEGGSKEKRAELISALSLDATKYKVLIIDLYHEERFYPNRFGVEDQVIYDVYDVLNGINDIENSVVEVNDHLDLLSSSIRKDKACFQKGDIEKLQEQAAPYDVVLVDGIEAERSLWENHDRLLLADMSATDQALQSMPLCIDPKDRALIVRLHQIEKQNKNVLQIRSIVDFDAIDGEEFLQNLVEERLLPLPPLGILEQWKIWLKRGSQDE